MTFLKNRNTEGILLVCIIVSSILLSLGLGKGLSGFFLLLLSIPMMLMPASIIPMIFIGSWSSSVGVLNLAAFYYYFALFIISLAINRKQWTLNKSNLLSAVLLLSFAGWLMITGYLGVTSKIYTSLKIALTILFPITACFINLKYLNFTTKALVVLSLLFAVFFAFRATLFPIEYAAENGPSEMTVVPGMGTNVIGQVIIILYLFLFAYGVLKSNRVVLVASLLYFIILLFLGSRTALYTSLLLGIIILFSQRIKDRSKALSLLSICILVVLLFVFLAGHFDNSERLGVSTLVENQGSGRFLNWVLYFTDIIPNNVWTGIGTGLENFYELGYLYDADDLYVDLLCETGVIGFVLFFAAFISVVLKVLKKRQKTRGLLFSLVVSFLLSGVGESVFDNFLTWFILGYAIFMTNVQSCQRRTQKVQ